MMFENDLTPEPTLRSRIVDHIPIAIIVAGLLAALVSAHLALTGVIVAAAVHVLVGMVLWIVRRHHKKDVPQPGANQA